MIEHCLLQRQNLRHGLATLLAVSLFLSTGAARAGTVVFDFSGQTDAAVNVGSNSIPSGSSFHGQLVYDAPQTGTTTSFYGGTQTVYSFNSLTWTIGSQTVSEGPGQLSLYDNVTPPNGVPVGDSFYTFVPGISNNAPNPSTGSIDGVTPNYIYLGLVSSPGTAFNGTGLPLNLNLAQFSEAFLGVNYGPLGSGNIDRIFSLSSLGAAAVPEPSSVLLLLAGACVPAVLYARGLRR